MNNETETVLTRCLKLFKGLKHSADSKHSCDLATLGIELVETILNPKPQYEIVEVVQYILIDKKGIVHATSHKSFDIQETDVFGLTEVKLTGTYQKEVKPKVKHKRDFKNVKTIDDGTYTYVVEPNDTVIIEWEEDAE